MNTNKKSSNSMTDMGENKTEVVEKITCVKDAVDVATGEHKGQVIFWRGQSQEFDTLVPKLLRGSGIDKGWYLEKENFVFEHFIRHAYVRGHDLPKEEDRLSWLFVLQHYGAPTRLLDWTKSILNALFFAVNGDTDCNGELWGLNPVKQNEKVGIYGGYPTNDDYQLQYLAWEAKYRMDLQTLLTEMNMEKNQIPECPMCLFPVASFDRMSRQKSVFSIHPINLDNTSKDDFEGGAFVKYIIPNEYKYMIRDELSLIGVDNKSIFSDLTSISSDINFQLSKEQP